MLTRRDVLVALIAAVTTLTGVSALHARAEVLTRRSSTGTASRRSRTRPARSARWCRHRPLRSTSSRFTSRRSMSGETPHPPHKHPDEELVIIKEGTVESLVNGQLRRVGPGSIVFQAANQLHSIRNVGDTPATYHVIKWNSPGMLKAK